MATRSAVVLTVVSIALAAAIFYHFNFRLVPYMQPLMDSCGLAGPLKGTPRPFFKLGNAFLDGLHCLITPFFLDCVGQPAGRFWVLQTLATATPVVSLLAVEESRSSARGLVRCVFLVLVVAQLLGVSVALPALWLPCYLLLSKHRVQGAFLPAGKVPAIAAQAAMATAVTLPLVYATRFPEAAQPPLIAGFNLAVPCLALLWTLAPGGARPGNAAAARALRFVALIGFAAHALSVVDLFVLSHGGDADSAQRELAAVAANASADVMPANFMMYDFLGVLGSALIFVLAEEGLAGAGSFLGLSLLAGPGAAFGLACARREARLAAGSAKAPLPRGAPAVAAAAKRD